MGAISGLQQDQYGCDYATGDSVEVDYAAWAAAVKGVLGLGPVWTLAALGKSLERARSYEGLTLIHVPVYWGPDPLGGMGVFGRWNVGNWVRAHPGDEARDRVVRGLRTGCWLRVVRHRMLWRCYWFEVSGLGVFGPSSRTRSLLDGTVIADVQFGRPTVRKSWNALRDAEGEGVWNTKSTKGGERRERVSCISRPFVFFVLQSLDSRRHRRSSAVSVNSREGLRHWTLAVRVDVLCVPAPRARTRSSA